MEFDVFFNLYLLVWSFSLRFWDFEIFEIFSQWNLNKKISKCQNKLHKKILYFLGEQIFLKISIKGLEAIKSQNLKNSKSQIKLSKIKAIFW